MGEQAKPTEGVIKWRVHEGDLLDDDGEPLESHYWHVVTHAAFARVSAALASAREENEMLSRDSSDAALQIERDYHELVRLRERERVLTEALADANEWIRVVSDAADHVTWEQRGPGTIVHIITEPTTRPLFARAALEAAREAGRSENQ